MVIPQSEHGRLAGTLASLWGNEHFNRPEMDFAAFVQGVALHDWAYGLVDNLPIGGMSEAEWLELTEKGVANRFDHPVTDIVAKLHLRRLLSGRDSPDRRELIGRIDARIAERLPETGTPLELFERVDRITRFCDQLAFDFSFEKPGRDSIQVFTCRGSNLETAVSYQIGSGGEVWVDPWPFSATSISGILIGYQQEGFPEELRPVIVPFRVSGCLKET
jgi:hypothetical protein